MNDAQLHTLNQLQAFLKGTVAVGFSVGASERCGFITGTLRSFCYARLRRADTAHGTPSGPATCSVDSVHQDDQERVKGLCHLNTVDCVTQYERVATCRAAMTPRGCYIGTDICKWLQAKRCLDFS